MTDHLISSTLFALITLLAVILMRRQRAHWRHAMLLAGVLRFALPTPLLTAAGSALSHMLRAPAAAPGAMGDVTRMLFRAATSSLPVVHSVAAQMTLPIALMWGAGTAILAAAWLLRCTRDVRSTRAINASERSALEAVRRHFGAAADAEMRIIAATGTPAVQGIWRQYLLLPEGLADVLGPGELRAILTHELAHIRRRDNLSAAVVRLLVCVFWFHPLVWWMERRMLLERERACDELVLEFGVEPELYIASILKICHKAVAGAPGLAHATGPNLKSRMEQIMSIRNVSLSSPMPRAAFWALIAIAILSPVGSAVLTAQDSPGTSLTNPERAKLLRVEVTRSAIGPAEVNSTTEHAEALEHINRLMEIPVGPASRDASRYDRWLNEEVVFTISSEEAEAFKALTTDSERDQFIKQFWERRAIASGVPREENYRRLAYATSHYGTAEVRGTDTARGRIYVVMGPPDEIDSHVDRDGGGGFEQWVYRNFDQSTDNLTLTFLIAGSAQQK